MRHNHLTKRADDRDFKLAVEEALSDDSPKLRYRAGSTTSTKRSVVGPPPALSFSPAEEPDAMERHEDPRARETTQSPSIRLHVENDAEEDVWPWVDDGAQDLVVQDNVTEASRHVATKSAEPVVSENCHDQSATEDLILCEPPAARVEMMKLKPRSTATLGKGVRQPGVAPKRIGSGTLVPARLTWKPGDPFGQDAEPAGSRFRWEVMLRSACITAACGLLCVWLLHSIFA